MENYQEETSRVGALAKPTWQDSCQRQVKDAYIKSGRWGTWPQQGQGSSSRPSQEEASEEPDSNLVKERVFAVCTKSDHSSQREMGAVVKVIWEGKSLSQSVLEGNTQSCYSRTHDFSSEGWPQMLQRASRLSSWASQSFQTFCPLCPIPIQPSQTICC